MIHFSYNQTPNICFITAFETPASTSHLREAWAKELGVPLSDELWEEGLSSIQKCSINSRYRLIQFEVTHRLHYSKTKLNRIFESVSPMCDRCGRAEGSLSHLFWHCPVLDNFWSDIFNWFSKQYKINIQPDCNLAIFGSFERTSTLPSHCEQALKTGMVAAKKLISLNWKSPSSPCFKRCLNEMVCVSRMEQIRLSRGKAPNSYEKV